MKYRAEILEKIQSVPSIPVVAVQTARLLRDKEVSMDRLVETIKYDPVITANVLRLANSALLGSSRQAATLKDALVRLGTSRLSRLVIASSVKPILDQSLPGYNLVPGELWRHCVSVGISAEILETRVGGSDGEIAFTAGLLHDIGKLAIGSFIDRYLEQIEEKAIKEQISFETAEIEVLGIDHTELGASLLEEWGFPTDLVSVVRWHHDPDKASEYQYLADLVHIADMISIMMGIGIGNDGLQYKPSAESMFRLGLKKDDLELTASQMLGAMNEVLEKFESRD